VAEKTFEFYSTGESIINNCNVNSVKVISNNPDDNRAHCQASSLLHCVKIVAGENPVEHDICYEQVEVTKNRKHNNFQTTGQMMKSVQYTSLCIDMPIDWSSINYAKQKTMVLIAMYLASSVISVSCQDTAISGSCLTGIFFHSNCRLTGPPSVNILGLQQQVFTGLMILDTLLSPNHQHQSTEEVYLTVKLR